MQRFHLSYLYQIHYLASKKKTENEKKLRFYAKASVQWSNFFGFGSLVLALGSILVTFDVADS